MIKRCADSALYGVKVEGAPDGHHQSQQEQRERDAQHGEDTAPLVAKRALGHEASQGHRFRHLPVEKSISRERINPSALVVRIKQGLGLAQLVWGFGSGSVLFAQGRIVPTGFFPFSFLRQLHNFVIVCAVLVGTVVLSAASRNEVNSALPNECIGQSFTEFGDVCIGMRKNIPVYHPCPKHKGFWLHSGAQFFKMQSQICAINFFLKSALWPYGLESFRPKSDGNKIGVSDELLFGRLMWSSHINRNGGYPSWRNATILKNWHKFIKKLFAAKCGGPTDFVMVERYKRSLDGLKRFTADLIGFSSNYKLTSISRLGLDKCFLHEIGLPVVNQSLYAGDSEHKESYSESGLFHPVNWWTIALACLSPLSPSAEGTPNANAYGFVRLFLGGIFLACGITLCRGCYSWIDDSLLLALTAGIVGCIGSIVGIVLIIHGANSINQAAPLLGLLPLGQSDGPVAQFAGACFLVFILGILVWRFLLRFDLALVPGLGLAPALAHGLALAERLPERPQAPSCPRRASWRT